MAVDRYPANVEFTVIAETDDYIVVDKPAPLIVHPTDLSRQPTLIDGVAALLSYDCANGARLSIINRLDRETSGIVLIAKHKTAARHFSRAMERRQVKKRYIAIVHGVPDWETTEVDAPIGSQRDIRESRIWLKQTVSDHGKEAVTYVEKIRSVCGFTVLHVRPTTGRMHQIRVHCQHLGFPIVGDKIYGEDENLYLEHIEHGWNKELETKLLMPRHALHACGLEVMYKDEWLKFECPIPEDFVTFLNGQAS